MAVAADGYGVLLAACLIVKDGAETLARCLRSLTGFVDEVVVYDTGSTDGSVEVARDAGARVIEGYWDEDFARARNAALAAVHADWVLSIDADEIAEAGGRAELGSFLRGLDAGTGVLAVQRHDRMPSRTASYDFRTPRLFRRSGAQWSGRVHETVEVHGTDGAAAASETCPPRLLRLVHDGYADAAQARAKARRNAQIGAAEMDQLRADPGTTPGRLARCLLDLGRSLVACDDLASAVPAFDAVRLLVPGGEPWARATDHLARARLALGECAAASALSDELRVWGAEPAYCDWLLAQALAQSGEPLRAVALLANVGELTDPSGHRFDPALIAEFRDLAGALATALAASA